MPLEVHIDGLLLRDAGGNRTHFKLLCRQLPRHLAPASNKKTPAVASDNGG